MKKYRLPNVAAVVFDAVGTLVEPEPSVEDVYSQAACRQGIAISPSAMSERFARSLNVYAQCDQDSPRSDEASERQRWRSIVSACLPGLPDADRAFAELWRHFAQPSSWLVHNDVAPTLDVLVRRGFLIAVASNF